MPNKFVGHGPYHYAKGGEVRRELKFMEDKGAPKSMIAAEKKEHGIGKKFADGGVTEGPNANIDDDTRARALEMVRQRMQAGEQAPPEAAPAAPAPRPRPARPPVSPAYRAEGGNAPRPAPQTPPITPERAAAAEAIASAMSPERAQMMAAKRAQQQKAIAEAAHVAAIQDSMRKANAAPAAAAAPQARQQPYMPAAPSNKIPGMRQAPGMAAGGSIDGCATRGKTRARRG